MHVKYVKMKSPYYYLNWPVVLICSIKLLDITLDKKLIEFSLMIDRIFCVILELQRV